MYHTRLKKNIMSKRLNQIALRNIYKPDITRGPLNKPFALRNSVSMRKNKQAAASCISEMSLLMACWKKNSYNDGACPQEIAAFQKCFVAAEKEKVAFKEASKAGKMEAGRTTSEQINKLMSKYPQTKR